MQEKSDTSSLPPTLQRIALTLRTVGWICFWMQLVLAVVSTVILLLYSVSSRNPATKESSQGAGVGIFFAICGLVTLGVSIYWAFRYTRLARQLQESGTSKRPSKADTIQSLRVGLIVNLVGTLLTLIGAEGIIGSTLARSLSQQAPVIVPGVPGATGYIQPLDLFVVQANTNTLFAHFVGIVAALWLLNRVAR